MGEAKRRLASFENELSAEANKTKSAEAYKAFAENWPDKQQVEKEAIEKNTVSSNTTFMRDWPASAQAHLAQTKLEFLEAKAWAKGWASHIGQGRSWLSDQFGKFFVAHHLIILRTRSRQSRQHCLTSTVSPTLTIANG